MHHEVAAVHSIRQSSLLAQAAVVSIAVCYLLNDVQLTDMETGILDLRQSRLTCFLSLYCYDLLPGRY